MSATAETHSSPAIHEDPAESLKRLRREIERLRREEAEIVRRVRGADLPRGQLKQWIEWALRNAPSERGSTAADIRELVRLRWNVAVSPNTVSVTLWRLKEQGHAHLAGRRWFPSSGNTAHPATPVEGEEEE